MDTTILADMKEDDALCFQEIYNKHAFKVYGFVKKHTNQTADVEDIVQNVFIHLWKYRHKLNPETTIEAVLFKSAKQEIAKWYKETNKTVAITDNLITDIDVFEQVHDSTLKVKAINLWLSKMPLRRQQVFKLSRFDGLNYNEIANRMNMTPGAVANQISITLRYLKINASNHTEIFSIMFIIMPLVKMYIGGLL